MEQNQGVDEILRCLRVSFLQLYNLFLSQPHKDERFMWESCQQKYNFTGKFGLKKTWLIWQLTWSYPRCWPVLFLHSRVALVKVSALRTLYFIGIKEVAWNVNLRARNLYPDYSNSFILSNASELFLSRISSLPRERNLSCRLFTSSIKREIRHFPVVVVQWRQRNVQKKRDARAELLFCLFNLLLFWRSRCRRRRGILKSLMIASVQKPPLLEKNWRVQASPRLFFFFWRERGVCTLAMEMSTYNSKRNVLNFNTFVTNIILWNWRSNKAHQFFLTEHLCILR